MPNQHENADRFLDFVENEVIPLVKSATELWTIKFYLERRMEGSLLLMPWLGAQTCLRESSPSARRYIGTTSNCWY